MILLILITVIFYLFYRIIEYTLNSLYRQDLFIYLRQNFMLAKLLVKIPNFFNYFKIKNICIYLDIELIFKLISCKFVSNFSYHKNIIYLELLSYFYQTIKNTKAF